MKKIILASASPRRKELLSRAGITYSVVVSTGEENPGTTDPVEAVKRLSRQKASCVAEKLKEDPVPMLIIGADTVVAFEGKILGKPVDKEDAFRTLMCLQGKRHQVYTGVTLLRKKQDIWEPFTFCEKTEVEFYPVSENEIRDYIESGEPMDKAGSYGIQGTFGIYVKGIAGDYNNVVGLPVGRLVYELKRLGIKWKGQKND